MSIYSELIERVDNGETFYVDFENQTIKVGKEYLVKNGEYDTSKELFGIDIYDLYAAFHMIRELYKNYKYSLPSERSDNKRKKYFKALSVDELTDEQLVVGEPREVAQFTLEAFILCTILSGDFVWEEELHGKWFFQHKSDPDLIILRNWVESK